MIAVMKNYLFYTVLRYSEDPELRLTDRNGMHMKLLQRVKPLSCLYLATKGPEDALTAELIHAMMITQNKSAANRKK